MSKVYDICAKVGEYEKDGETKGRYENVGAVMKGENGSYIILNRSFNPAGVPNPKNSPSVLLSLFEPKAKMPGQRGRPQSEYRQSDPRKQATERTRHYQDAGTSTNELDFDDGIPF